MIIIENILQNAASICRAISKYIFPWIGDNIFAISSFLISLYTLWSNRQVLSINWAPNIVPVQDSTVMAMDKDFQPIAPYNQVFLANITVINPSKNDLAFFNLYAFDPATDNSLSLLTKKTYINSKEKDIIHVVGDTFYKLDIPDQKSGVFKANSFTRFDLPVVITNKEQLNSITSIGISFRIAKRRLFHPHKYEKYKTIYHINGWQKILGEKAEMQPDQKEYEKGNKE